MTPPLERLLQEIREHSLCVCVCVFLLTCLCLFWNGCVIRLEDLLLCVSCVDIETVCSPVQFMKMLQNCPQPWGCAVLHVSWVNYHFAKPGKMNYIIGRYKNHVGAVLLCWHIGWRAYGCSRFHKINNIKCYWFVMETSQWMNAVLMWCHQSVVEQYLKMKGAGAPFVLTG